MNHNENNKNIKYNLDPNNLSEEEKLLTSCKEFSLFLLKIRSRTESQLRQKLESKKIYSSEIIDKCIESLKNYSYIDDDAYCKRYIELNCKNKSYRAMRLKLFQKGIDNDLLDKYFNSRDEDCITDKEKNENETAKKLLEKKIGNLDSIKDMEYKEKSKLYGYLARKGFSYDIIDHLIK